MDPTLNALAHKMRFEMLAEAQQPQSNSLQWSKTLRHQLGILLEIAGQKLQVSELKPQARVEEGGYLLLDHEGCE